VSGLPSKQAGEPHKQAVSTAFGAIAPFYDAWYTTPIGRYVWAVETAATLALLSAQETGIALEIGVGTGMALGILKTASHNLVGIDISWQMLQNAYEKTQADIQTHLVLADGENLPFRKNSLSLIMGMTVIEFVPNPSELLLEVRRVLHIDGRLILGVLTSTNLWALERRIRNLVTPDVFQFAAFPSPWQMKRMLHRAGFTVCATKGSVYAPSFVPSRCINQLAQIDQVLGQQWLTRPWGAFYSILACLSKTS